MRKSVNATLRAQDAVNVAFTDLPRNGNPPEQPPNSSLDLGYDKKLAVRAGRRPRLARPYGRRGTHRLSNPTYPTSNPREWLDVF